MNNKAICTKNKDLENKIKNIFNDSRLSHTLGTAKMARRLAGKFDINPEKSYRAGLLHDICKGLSQEEMLEILQDSSWKPDCWEKTIPALLHAPASAARAEREFGINDVEVLEAIRFHTTGFAGMEKLTAIIFLADKIEPNRKYPGSEKAREKLQMDFNQALITVCNNTINFLLKNSEPIHPNTILLRNYLLRRKQVNDG